MKTRHDRRAARRVLWHTPRHAQERPGLAPSRRVLSHPPRRGSCSVSARSPPFSLGLRRGAFSAAHSGALRAPRLKCAATNAPLASPGPSLGVPALGSPGLRLGVLVPSIRFPLVLSSTVTPFLLPLPSVFSSCSSWCPSLWLLSLVLGSSPCGCSSGPVVRGCSPWLVSCPIAHQPALGCLPHRATAGCWPPARSRGPRSRGASRPARRRPADDRRERPTTRAEGAQAC